MKSLGKHLIIELYECDREIINDLEAVEHHIMESVRVSGASIIKPYFHKFSPHGISGMVIIAESHFSIHTWPEYGYCAVDIFTCGDLIQGDKAMNYLKEHFKCQNVSLMEIKRGVLDLPDAEIKHKPDQS
ncbi:MAG: S-adenosylmethionine decarboxylase proenzyme [Deltaproteobacteria bacterium]|nr:S-adenosylmethionine decarboxylase proenzyme [Deltaproteobacteria bacterium]